MKTVYRYLCLNLIVGLCALGAANQVFAQSDLKPDEKASVAFDIRLNRMMADVKAMGVDLEPMAARPLDGPLGDTKLDQIERIFGAFSLPADLASAMNPAADVPPLDAFVRIRFTSPKIAESALENLKQSGGEATINGKTYVVQDPDNPESMMAQLVSANELEIGTGRYVLQPNRNLMSDGLASVWRKVPDDGFRVAVDLSANRNMIQEAMAMAQQDAPPFATPFVGLLDNFDSFILAADLKNKNLLSLVIEGANESDAEELSEGLNSLFQLAKLSAAGPMGQMSQQLPEAAAPAKAIMDALTANVEGKVVQVIIPRPEGLDEAVVKLSQAAGQAAQRTNRMNQMRQFALAAMNYHDAYKKFPFNAGPNQNEALSWRVRVLPFIEEMAIYDQLDMKQGPDAEPNARFANQMPKIYGEDGKMAKVVWVKSGVNRFADVIDGTSNTIMMIEFNAGTPWMENGDISQADALKLIQGLDDGETMSAVFYDGSVHTLDNSVAEETLKRLLDPRDGQVVDFF